MRARPQNAVYVRLRYQGEYVRCRARTSRGRADGLPRTGDTPDGQTDDVASRARPRLDPHRARLAAAASGCRLRGRARTRFPQIQGPKPRGDFEHPAGVFETLGPCLGTPAVCTRACGFSRDRRAVRCRSVRSIRGSHASSTTALAGNVRRARSGSNRPLTEVLQDQPEGLSQPAGGPEGGVFCIYPSWMASRRAKPSLPPWPGSGAPARQVPRWNHPSRLRVDEPKPQLANREPRDGS
jgi:hypothetical protein